MPNNTLKTNDTFCLMVIYEEADYDRVRCKDISICGNHQMITLVMKLIVRCIIIVLMEMLIHEKIKI